MKHKLLLAGAIVLSACSPGGGWSGPDEEVQVGGGNLNCEPSSYSSISVGNNLPGDAFTKAGDGMILGGESKFLKKHFWTDGDLTFELGTDRNSDEIKIIIISDPNFRTAQCVKVGTTYADMEKLTRNNAVVERGWAHYFPLEDGWNAAFVSSDKRVDPKKKVTYFFKRAG